MGVKIIVPLKIVVEIDPLGIKSLDEYNDLEENWGKGAFVKFTNLKNVNPNLITLLAIGGWNEGNFLP